MPESESKEEKGHGPSPTDGKMECDFCGKPLNKDYVTIQVRKRDFDNHHKIIGTYIQYKLHDRKCWGELERVILTKIGKG